MSKIAEGTVTLRDFTNSSILGEELIFDFNYNPHNLKVLSYQKYDEAKIECRLNIAALTPDIPEHQYLMTGLPKIGITNDSKSGGIFVIQGRNFDDTPNNSPFTGVFELYSTLTDAEFNDLPTPVTVLKINKAIEILESIKKNEF